MLVFLETQEMNLRGNFHDSKCDVLHIFNFLPPLDPVVFFETLSPQAPVMFCETAFLPRYHPAI